MFCKVNCAAIIGIEVHPVIVETDVSNGLPTFDMVGLLASDIKEARERVRTAIKNSGFSLPPKRITINFAPANIRKTGTYFDMPVAVSILDAVGIIQCDLSDKMFIGELSLNGDIVAVNGALPIVLCAVSMGIKQCYVPTENVTECRCLGNVEVIGVDTLNQLVMLLGTNKNTDEGTSKGTDKFVSKGTDSGTDKFAPKCTDGGTDKFAPKCTDGGTDNSKHSNILKSENAVDNVFDIDETSREDDLYDFRYIMGQEQARRAAEIAAAGMHNMLMVGPPGTGKSVIAKTLPTIMPDMLDEEVIEVSRIQSIMGLLKGGLVTSRPFRSPHYTTTVTAMTGGGLNPRPGEITLAHRGVLYMDEFAEFSKNVIETLRQPLEDRKIVVSRNGGSFEFPADFILVASMNPCKCGYYPDRNKCNCTDNDVQNYMKKVSGPIMDRMDLWVHMNGISWRDLNDKKCQEDSASIRGRINKAVQIQRDRYRKEKFNFNGQLSGKNIEKYCPLGDDEKRLLEQIYEKMELSVRGYEKIIKVARTIADLKENENISIEDIGEAVSYRSQLV